MKPSGYWQRVLFGGCITDATRGHGVEAVDIVHVWMMKTVVEARRRTNSTRSHARRQTITRSTWLVLPHRSQTCHSDCWGEFSFGCLT